MRTLILALVFAATQPAQAQPRFMPMGHFSNGVEGSIARAISADGTTIVGSASTNDPGSWRPFRWTADTGMVNLGVVPPNLIGQATAMGVSADGGVVAGWINDNSGPSTMSQSFRWTAETGLVGIGDLPGGSFRSEALDVSGDGSIIVGWGIGADFATRPYRYTQATGMIPLAGFPGLIVEGMAAAASTDGSTIVGQVNYEPGGRFEAVRWNAAGEVTGLGLLGGASSEALAVNADGSVIVGQTISVREIDGVPQVVWEAFRWTEPTGMVHLGHLPGDIRRSRAVGVSADGSVIIGNGGAGWVWTEEAGMRSIYNIFTDLGLDLMGWESLGTLDGISADGTRIVGSGFNAEGFSEAWMLIIPAPSAAPALAAIGLLAIRRRS